MNRFDKRPIRTPRRFLRAVAMALTSCLAVVAGNALAQGQIVGGAAERIALVIGNAGYPQAMLKNPVNDAKAVATALRELGFEVVYRENTGLGSMLDAMREFVLKGRESQVRVFFFAGHGAQLKGKNYLIPVDAAFKEEEDVPLKTANVSELIDRLGQMKEGVNIVILDACRNTPFPIGTRTRGLINTRSLAPGLAQISAPRGTLIAYSTAPGAVALDGTDSSNSAFTKYLLENMQIPGLPVELLFKRVRVAVSQETREVQIPWETNSLRGDFCFRPLPNGECAVVESTVATTPTAVKERQAKNLAR